MKMGWQSSRPGARRQTMTLRMGLELLQVISARAPLVTTTLFVQTGLSQIGVVTFTCDHCWACSSGEGHLPQGGMEGSSGGSAGR